MKKYVKIIALVVVMVTAAVCLLGCGGKESAVDKIKKAGKLTMLTEPGFAPYEYLGADGKVVGVDVEICQKVADKLGVKLEVVSMDFDGIVAAVQSGKGDLGAAGMSVTDERKQAVDFSKNYVDSGLYFIVKKGAEMPTEDTMANFSVGVQLGTTSDIFMSDTEADVQRFKTVPDSVIALQTGKIDAVMCDQMPAQSAVNNNSDLEMSAEAYTTEQYAIAVAKGNDELMEVVNSVLDEMLASGEIDKLISEHMELAKQA